MAKAKEKSKDKLVRIPLVVVPEDVYAHLETIAKEEKSHPGKVAADLIIKALQSGSRSKGK